MNDVVLTVVAIVTYWVIALAIGYALRKKFKGLEVSPFFIIFKKPSALSFLDKYEKNKFLRGLIYASVILTFISLFMFYYYMIEAVALRFSGYSSGGLVPIIPGITIKGTAIIYILISIGIAALIHELSHAFASRVAHIPVKNVGFILAVFIPAAFVEPDEEAFKKASFKDKIKILSAGPSSNLIIAFIFLILILLMTVNAVGATVVSVESGSPAQIYGIKPGYTILEINGTKIGSPYDIGPIIENYTNSGVWFNITYRSPSSENLSWLLVYKPSNVSKIGITIEQAKGIQSLPDSVYFPMLEFFTFMYVINFSLAIINAAPIFITDGGRIISEIISLKIPGNKGKALNFFIQTFTLLLVLSAITFTPIA
ncbi:site-2 protease family protein [Fervidicoccus fontis]|uniref:Peptidase M50 n=2 Tax=Fervidicoccus fontis TaxID=683846 RepID=H9ZZJ4_FERFK|nr:site-2 protease family protein [Fervidicoccus fontis]AFH42151.1 peptidase M50 [Fervidicoccus fontis Kam940]MBE9390904.1 site-2 protease family protein [Fervidicoccus fontis]PMB78014.1 MAG: sigma E protease regulator RseP [Fervidicoccus fontis]HEW64439.1 hypothetical protein [Fervidicoccus fontis]